MKIRTGFVSNSSSSSFILRGICIEEEKLAKLWKITPEDSDKRFELLEDNAIKRKLDILSTKNYYSDEETGKVIVGKECGEISDGEVFGFPMTDDKKIIAKLKNNNIPVTELTTYFQYISNDNY